jgi:hypothetical protein
MASNPESIIPVLHFSVNLPAWWLWIPGLRQQAHPECCAHAPDAGQRADFGVVRC